MGLFDFLKRDRKQKEIRSIISNYYGGDWKYFVWNYANQIYDIPEVRTAIETPQTTPQRETRLRI